MIHKYLFFFLLPFIIASCSGDEPNNPDNLGNKPLPEPEQTVTVSIYKNGKDNIDGLYIGTDDYFVISNPPQWLICCVGKVNGLADIVEIPISKWSVHDKVRLGYGYIAYNRHTGTFYRLYISNVAKDELGTITGYQVKYTKPFYGIDETPSFTQTTALFGCDGGATELHYSNKSIIPIVVSSAPEWCKVSLGLPMNPDESDIDGLYNAPGVFITASQNYTSNPRSAIIKLSTKYGKTIEIIVSQEGKNLPVTTSILDLKKTYWSGNDFSCNTIGNDLLVVIRGKVISSDESGNIYKQLVVQDETAAITFSINAYNIYGDYKIGDDITIDLRGFSIGRYFGEFEIGELMNHAAYGNTISFLPYEQFRNQSIYNSSNNEVKAIETTIDDLNSAKATSDGLQKWQSQFIQLRGVTFEEKNVPLSENREYTNRYVTDSNGHKLAVRTSGYSNFYTQKTPSGAVNLCGIIHFNSQSNEWNLILIDSKGITSL